MTTLRPNTKIAGKYRLERLIGEGAMGEVWQAVNEATDRRVAIKLISRSAADSDELRARVLREARACGRIAHRNVVEVFDAGETAEGSPFLVMPILSGETLASRIERMGRLPDLLAARVGLEIARGLAAAHAAGIVHRDLKPGNVFLAREPDGDEETVKLLDFGVSKILSAKDNVATATGSALGSPAYMSPEQARGDRGVDHRSDLWALGVVLFEMIAGSRPFVGDSPYTCVAEILSGRIPDVRERLPAADARLANVIARCLEREVQRRVGTAAEVADALRAYLGQSAAGASGPLPMSAASLPALPPQPASSNQMLPSVTSTMPVLREGSVKPQRPVGLLAAIGGLSAVAVVVMIALALVVATRYRSAPAASEPGSAHAGAPTVTSATASSRAAPHVDESVTIAPSATPTETPTTRPTVTTRPNTTHGPIVPPSSAKSAAPRRTHLPTDPG